MKVKDFPEWRKLIFNDRAILKSDLRFFNWEQIKSLDNMEVITTEDHERTLIIENR